MNEVDDCLAAKEEVLRELLRASVSPRETLLVAYSGGVDSAYLAWVAHTALGSSMKAVIADSPSLPRKELAQAVAFAQEHEIPLEIITTGELKSQDYTRNDALRCFHCKDELFRVMTAFEAKQGALKIAYGRNVDDSGDFRPGQRAAEEHAVLAPLVDAGLTKADIRALARRAGLALWDKPGAACLASRIEYGREVSVEVLAQVEAAEEFLHSQGFKQVRVRHHGEMARVEIGREEIHQAFSLEAMDRIHSGIKAAGFRHVALDMSGYRSGSMNNVIPVETLLEHSK